MNLSRFARKTHMAHYTLIARINTGNGKFPFVNVQFSKNHRPIPMEGATYYLRPSGGKPPPTKKSNSGGAGRSAPPPKERSEPPHHNAGPAPARPSPPPP